MPFDNLKTVTCNKQVIEFPASYGSLSHYARYLIANIKKCAEYNLDEALAAYVSQYLPLYQAGHKSKRELPASVLKVLEEVCA